jgi:glycosyltransferase involved in cell wall biosynthesis
MSVLLLADRYPELSETFVAAEARALRDVRVESIAPPETPADDAPPPAVTWTEETTRGRLAAMARLAARHPLRCLADLRDRRRWRREEPVPPLRMLAPAALRPARHVHVHFAASAALAALRLTRITGATWSVTAHGYEIFQRPANLREKLVSATFVTTGSAYAAEHLRRVAPAASVHEVPMGVDPDRFQRSAPAPGGRTVVAVGRLVEKKGFADLVDAAARLGDVEVLIAGQGPERGELERRIAAQGAPVTLLGAVTQDVVRDLLEQADVLCLPCVVAADGDRDSMPVVVKEALAMEVPVVATDVVGLPEVVQPGWGTLVPPHDPPALAAALAAELGRPLDERRARGRAGREFVRARFTTAQQVAAVQRLIDEVAGQRRSAASRM